MTYQQLEAIRPRLREFWDDRQIDAWFQTPQKMLDWKEPIDCSYEEVDRLIAQLEDGAYI